MELEGNRHGGNWVFLSFLLLLCLRQGNNWSGIMFIMIMGLSEAIIIMSAARGKVKAEGMWIGICNRLMCHYD
jgi:hypothetical protein